MNVFSTRLCGSACLWALIATLLPASAGAEEARAIDGHKLTIKSYVDFGHLVNGWNTYADSGKKDINMLPLNRTNVVAIQDITVGKVDLSVGLAALVWWPYTGQATTDLSERIMNVKPMVPVARARWQFGDPATTTGSLLIGTFSHKYNPDAKNLGEYLYRAGTYPGYLWSNDGWLLMNRAGSYSHGFLLNLAQMGGKLKHNFSLFMETAYYPIGDFSPGYDFSFTSKWFDVGGGSVLNHYLPLRPSNLTPKEDRNKYATIRFLAARDTSVGAPIDTVARTGALSAIAPPDRFVSALDTNTLHRWTFKGVKVMGRAALNFGHLLPDNIRGPEDLRLFAEVAVLGWGNQPLYYEKRSERIPIMFGLTVPTGKLLDVLTLQGEYYKSPYNDIEIYNDGSLPIWETAYTDSVHADDFKWTVHGKKSMGKIMNLYFQAGSDHFRLTNGKYKVSSVPLTTDPKEWYYLFRLEFNLR